MEDHKRVIVHLDIDAFYAQVEEVNQPELKTKPLGVYQKTIIVTSNYIAREYGITKCMLTTEAIKLCPNLVLVNGENLEKYRKVSQDITKFIQEKYKVPVEKLGFDENFVNITKLVEDKLSMFEGLTVSGVSYKDGNLSDEDDFGMNQFDSRSSTCEEVSAKRKSGEMEPDEIQGANKKTKLNTFASELTVISADRDISTVDMRACSSEQEHVIKGDKYSNVMGHVYQDTSGKCSCGCISKLIIGTHIAHEMRLEIFKTFNLTLSGGISYNKLLSKLVSSLHKPYQQTVIFPNSVLDLLSTIPLRQIPGIGSKMFEKLQKLNIRSIADLQNSSRPFLCKEFDATTAEWLSNISFGKDSSKVKMFSKQSSIGVEDRYYKPITNIGEFKTQSQILVSRLLALIRKDGRSPKILKIHLRFDHFKFEFKLDSKQCQINPSIFSNSNDTTVENYLSDMTVKLYKELCLKKSSQTIMYINIAVGNFIDAPNSENSILKFCQKSSNKQGLKCSSQIFESPIVSRSSITPKSSLNEGDILHTNNDESSSNVNFNEQTAASTHNNTREDCTVERFFNRTSEGDEQPPACQTESRCTDSIHNQPSSKGNTLNMNNIDRDVLSELPADIREEIERELNCQNSQSSSQRSNDRRTLGVASKTVKTKKKTVRQLSMMNFVQKK